jgi:acyl carrier protein
MPSISQAEVGRDVTEFIVKNYLFGNASDMPAPSASFMDSGLVDSTGVLELIAYIEGKYAIKVADEEIVPTNLDSVDSVAAFVVRKVGV